MFDIEEILKEDSKQRQNTLSAIVGMQGVGKTTFIVKDLIAPLMKTKGVLIYDYSSEKKYRNIPIINLSDLKRWQSNGVYRVFDPDPVKVFQEFYRSLRNCFLICEDAKSYMKPTLNEDIAKVLGLRRQLGLDIICNFWALENVPTTVFTYSNYITIFKTRDKEEKLYSLDKIPNPDDVIKVWRKVQEHPNKHYNLTVATNS